MAKGVTLLGELVAFIFLIGIGYALGGMIIYTNNISGWLDDIHQGSGTADFSLTVKTGIYPVIQEDALLSLMEADDPYTGVEMKRVFEAAVAQNRISDIYIDGKFVDLQSSAGSIFASAGWAPQIGGNYLLVLRTPQKNFAISGNIETSKKVIKVQKAVAKIYSSGGEGLLELYTG
jgi:hypothetical protein